MIAKKLLLLILCILLTLAAGLSSCAVFGGRGDSGGANSEMHETDRIIPEETVKQIVLSRVDGATEDDFTRFEIEQDEGHWIYDGELLYKGIEYEFEIESCNGNILKWELEN